MKRLRVQFAGLKLENPLIVSSGPATQYESYIRRAAEMNPGAIVIKSGGLEREQSKMTKPTTPGHFPGFRPMYSRAGRDSYVFTAAFSYDSCEIMAEMVKRLKKDLKVPVIASSIESTIDAHVEAAKLFEDAGADAIEMDFCPMPWIVDSEAMSVEAVRDMNVMKDLVRQVKKVVKYPVGVKASPDPMFPDSIAKGAYEGGADFAHILAYSACAPGVDIETGKPLLPTQSQLTSGPLMKYITLRNVRESAKTVDYTKLHLTSSGGIMNWRDALEFMMYGCTTVQLCAIIAKRGYKVIKEIVDGLLQYVERKGLKNITEIRGITQKHQLVSDMTVLDAWNETKGKIIAEVDEERCNLCGLCIDPCLDEAIHIEGDKLIIDEDKCICCALCAVNCPKDAIKILNVDYYFELEKKKGLRA